MLPLNYTALTDSFADISTASTLYFASPDAGWLRSAQITLNNAITLANSLVTFKVDNVTVGGTLTIAFTGSAKGTTFNIEFAAVAVKKGSLIEVITDGGATTTCIAACTVMVSP